MQTLVQVIYLLVLLTCAAKATALELQAPDRAPLDSDVSVSIVGQTDPRSFVSIVPTGTPEGEYLDYVYARSATVKARAPAQTGAHEVRLLAAERPYATLASRPIALEMPDTTMQAPDSVPLGTEFSVQWTGPSASREFISLVPLDLPDGEYKDYAYVRGDGSGSIKLTTPAQPGAYQLRYMTGSKRVVIGRRALLVSVVDASISHPASVIAGATLEVAYNGPGHPRDFITIVKPDAALREYGDYVYTREPTVKLHAPEQPGNYEVRFLTADHSLILARGALKVLPTSASLQAPEQIEAGGELSVGWTGPNNDLDYIAISAPQAPGEALQYTYTKRGNPLLLGAPKTPGEYQLHYMTGRSQSSLAMQILRVTPAATPGRLRVTATGSDAAGSGTGAIELILDASGSMLQKLGERRRIELARDALEQLIQRDIAAGTPVALRVFGHRQPDACDTQLLQALAPLDRAALTRQVRGIEAKNLARTPIAASLAAVAQDLSAVEGPVLVVLITDGEETCEGDPAAEITRLRQSGMAVVLNIVGFAIDEYALEREFERWAQLGGGAYFSAQDAQSLSRSVSQAMRQPFAVYRGDVQVAAGVVNGEALSLPAGSYTVRIGSQRHTVDIQADTDSKVQL